MTKRKRSRVGGSRRDAALDAMRRLEFPESLVRRTLNDLLKVYDNGWAFIEGDCYKVLIEAILDPSNQNQPQKDQGHLMENQPDQDQGNQVDDQRDQPNLMDIYPHQDNGVDEQQCQQEEFVENVHQPLECEQVREEVDSLAQLEVSGKGMCVQEMSKQEKPIKGEFPVDDHVTGQGSQKVMQKSKPCFGWISDDEEDD